MNNTIRSSSLLFALFLLAGCSTIKSVFPDKEKDYRFTRELPDLIVPNTLDNKSEAVKPMMAPNVSAALPPVAKVTKQVTKKTRQPVTEANTTLETVPLNEAPIEASEVTKEAVATPPVAKAIKKEPSPVTSSETTAASDTPIDVSTYAEGVAEADAPIVTQVTVRKIPKHADMLHINQNLQRTARIVGKALTQQSIEITERNTAKHYFVVQYDPSVKPMQDESIWDELDFIFGEENNKEQPYRITLTETDQQTDIGVLDKNGKECSDGACSQLLRVLKTAIAKSLEE